jgi:methionyl-tRNA synthetase
MARTISTTEYLNYEGTKFSKTRGVGVFGNDVIDTGIPVEVWRYYLLSTRPEGNDAMFLWDDFAAKTNSELPNNIGNLVQRALAFLKTKLGGALPPLATPASPEDAGSAPGEVEQALERDVSAQLDAYVTQFEAQRLKEALKTAMRISELGNAYMQGSKPWELLKSNPARCHTVIHVITQLVFLLTVVFEPFMPSFSRKVLAQLDAELPVAPLRAREGLSWPLTDAKHAAGGLFLPAGHAIGSPAPIFSKIEPTAIEALRRRFQGKQGEQGPADGAEFPLTVLVGSVAEVAAHPNNPKCYVVQVDCGEEARRQLVCNWVDAYTPEQLQGRKVCVLTNLKPSKFGGVLSQGLMLTAMNVTDQGTFPVALTVDAPVGAKVLPRGAKHAPVKTFDVKKKLSGLMLSVGAEGRVVAGDVDLVAGEQAVSAEGVAEGARVC